LENTILIILCSILILLFPLNTPPPASVAQRILRLIQKRHQTLFHPATPTNVLHKCNRKSFKTQYLAIKSLKTQYKWHRRTTTTEIDSIIPEKNNNYLITMYENDFMFTYSSIFFIYLTFSLVIFCCCCSFATV